MKYRHIQPGDRIMVRQNDGSRKGVVVLSFHGSPWSTDMEIRVDPWVNGCGGIVVDENDQVEFAPADLQIRTLYGIA